MLLLALLLLLPLPLVSLGYFLYRLALWIHTFFGYYLLAECKSYGKKLLHALCYLAGSIVLLGAFLAIFWNELTFM